MPLKSIYTVGHSNHSFTDFVDLLQQHRIATLVDVRSHPYSKYVPHFQKQPLSQALAEVGLRYVFLGDELGGKLGHRDYARRAREPDFRRGLAQLVAIAEDAATAIMCAEEDPRRCHRRGLVTPPLVEACVHVLHLRGDATLEHELDLRRESPQLSLFAENH